MAFQVLWYVLNMYSWLKWVESIWGQLEVDKFKKLYLDSNLLIFFFVSAFLAFVFRNPSHIYHAIGIYLYFLLYVFIILLKIKTF